MISEKSYSIKLFSKYLFNKKERNHNQNNYFFMGRDALEYLIFKLNINADSKILYPAYSCIDTLIPFQKVQSKIFFYDINLDLSLDIDNLNSQIRKNDINVFFWVNYFGRIQKNVDKLIDEFNYNLTFIEDNTHSFLSKNQYKNIDASFSSLRKLLPITDGASLKLKENTIAYNSRFNLYSNLFSIIAFIKEIPLFKDIKISRRKLNESIKSVDSNNIQTYNNISLLSITILNRILFEEIISYRGKIFSLWESKLKKRNAFILIDVIDDYTCPYGFVILIPNRDNIILKLKNKGIYIKIDWELNKSELEHKISNLLSKNSMTLPINQNINENQIDKITKLIDEQIGDDWSFKLEGFL